MASVDIGGVPRWFLLLLFAVGILIAVKMGFLRNLYVIQGKAISMQTIAFFILVVGLLLGGIYYMMDLNRKIR